MARKNEKPLYIEMDFAEALERFGTTDPDEMPESIRLKKGEKAGRKKRPADQPSSSAPLKNHREKPD